MRYPIPKEGLYLPGDKKRRWPDNRQKTSSLLAVREAKDANGMRCASVQLVSKPAAKRNRARIIH